MGNSGLWAAGFAVAEHAAEFVAIAETGGEQALERILGRGAQPARARPAVGAAGEFERERRDVRLGVAGLRHDRRLDLRSEEHTSELQSLMRISYAVFCLKKKNKQPHLDNSRL